MCGIALVVGASPDPATFAAMMAGVASRGEVREVLSGDGLLAGTQRLPIVDRDRAGQPWVSADGRWVLCFNGEIFNFREIRPVLSRMGFLTAGDSDTEIVMAAFLAWGADAVRHLRGEYAFAVAERATGWVYLARDPFGVKPLYWSQDAGHLYLASEIKALVPIGVRINEVPSGHHGWAGPDSDPEFSAHMDVRRFDAGQIEIDDPDEAAKLVRAALEDSVQVRVDTDLTVGVILSGGLDSTLTLLQARQFHPDCVAFTVGAPGSEDLAYARRLTADFGIRHEVIELRPRDIRLADIREAIRVSELTEYGDIINAVVSVPLFRRVRQLGIKVVLTGDGSDELFGGYPMYQRIGPGSAHRLFRHKLHHLCRTELQRVDRASMAVGVEARVPFLDPAVVEVAARIPAHLKMRDGQEKWIVREAFADMLPDYIRTRPKNPMSHSSGLHERARLYKPMFARIHHDFGYGLLAPVRRDFGTVLTQCDHDLDRTERELAARGDHTAAEHARDLLGAVRWNLLSRRAGRPGPDRAAMTAGPGGG